MRLFDMIFLWKRWFKKYSNFFNLFMQKILFILLSLISLECFSQPIDSVLFGQLDFAPRWIWRGVSYSEGPVLQPSFGYSDKKFTAYIWGSYQIIKGEYHEINFVFEYKPIKQLKIGFTDYFGINDSTKNNQRFFNFENKTTSHVFDLYANLTPFKNIPLSFLVSNWFFGADKDAVTKQQNYSTYLELRYDKQFNDIGLYSFVGASPYKSFYYKHAGIVNLGIGFSKTYKVVKNLSLPMKVEFILNPSSENVYVNAVIGIR